MLTKDSRNYYEVLEIPTNASQDEIYNAYNKAKNSYNSDNLALYSLMSAEEAQQALQLIEEAYSILHEPIKRAEYNRIKGFQIGHSIPQSDSHFTFQSNTPTNPQQNHSSDFDFQHKSRSAYISSLSTNHQFALQYQEDPAFEEEIESATMFNGEFLQKIREYKQVSIERMSQMTKISKTNLKRLEADNFSELPADVYMRGFVSLYAKHLKLNAKLVATSYMNNIKSLRNDLKS